MAYETVHGYCWPQSVASGGTTELHLSSAGGRPVTVEVARVGATRDVVWTGRFEADEHPTPADAHSHGGRWPEGTCTSRPVLAGVSPRCTLPART